LEQHVVGIDVSTLKRLAGQCDAVLAREGIDVLANDNPKVLKAHLVTRWWTAGMSSMCETTFPSRTSSGVAVAINEIRRPVQRFSVLAAAWRSRSVRRGTYRSHSGTRKARWLSAYGPMSMPHASSRSCCIAVNRP